MPHSGNPSPTLRHQGGKIPAALGAALAAVAALGAVVLASTPAYAHAELVATSPSAGEKVVRPPERVTLEFDGPVLPDATGTVVKDGDGDVVNRGPARLSAANPALVVQPLSRGLGEGVYTVTWRAVSQDSDPVQGNFTFRVTGTPDPVAQASPSASAVSPPADPGTDADASAVGAPALADAGTDADADADENVGTTPVGVLLAMLRWLGYVGLALLVGGIFFVVFCWPQGWSDPAAHRLVWAGWLASIGASLVTLPLGPSAAGILVLARLVLLGILAAGLLRVRPTTGRAMRPAAVAVSLVVVVDLSLVWAAADSDSLLATVSHTAHLLAMSAWLGGLALLFGCVLTLRRIHDRSAAEAIEVLPRFSRLAVISIATLVVTGVYQTALHVDISSALAGSTYGLVLLFKLAAFGILLWLGTVSHGRAVRRYATSLVHASTGAGTRASARRGKRVRRAAEHRDRAALAELRSSVRIEVLIAAAILALTAALGSITPAGHDHGHNDGAAAVNRPATGSPPPG